MSVHVFSSKELANVWMSVVMTGEFEACDSVVTLAEISRINQRAWDESYPNRSFLGEWPCEQSISQSQQDVSMNRERARSTLALIPYNCVSQQGTDHLMKEPTIMREVLEMLAALTD